MIKSRATFYINMPLGGREGEKGQVLLAAVIFFVAISMLIMFGLLDPLTRRLQIINTLNNSARSYYLAESAHEDAVYRITNSMDSSSPIEVTIDGETASAVVNSTVEGMDILTTGTYNGAVRRVRTHLIEGTGVSFNYGAQSGEGGILMEQGSSIVGNVYSNGPLEGHSDGSKSLIQGTVVSAGSTGEIQYIHATGTVHANTILDSYIEGDAYYDTTLSNTTVLGDKYANEPDQPPADLPITQEMIGDWKDGAVNGGEIACNNGTEHRIDSSVTLGPNKIPCNLVVEKSGTVLRLKGNLWVEGNVTVQTQASVEVHSSMGSKSAIVIADNPSAPQTSGIINLRNNTTYYGNGNEGSYILFLSENTDALNGGSTPAIDLDNGASNDILLFADSGLIQMTQSADIKELTGYQLHLRNSVEVIYETGLASLLFDSGPGGGFEIKSWREVE